MKFTVNKIAKLIGVSVRALHYYDEIGLLSPKRDAENGYRIYDEDDLIRLQQIIFFTSLDFSLDETRKILDSKDFDSTRALEDQRNLLSMEKDRLTHLITTLDELLIKQKNMTTNTDDYNNYDEYKEEAKQRWGNTEAYKQSQERYAKLTDEEKKKIQEQGIKITEDLAKVMNHEVSSPEVQEVIERHYQHMNIFYDCSYEMYRNLGKMYITDERFTAYYEKFAPHLAEFMQKAIDFYCNEHEK